MSFIGNRQVIWGLFSLICLIWIIYDLFTNNKKLSMDMEVVWIILTVLFNGITVIIFYLLVKFLC